MTEKKTSVDYALLVHRSAAIYIALIFIPILWTAYFGLSSTEKGRALNQARSHVSAIATLFKEEAENIFSGTDRSLMLLRQGYESNPTNFDLKEWAKKASLTTLGVIQFALISANGHMIASTADYSGPPLFLGDREHFLALTKTSDDILYVATPVIGRASGKWSIQLSRRLSDRNGAFAGVIVGSIDPDQIGEFFNTAELGENGNIVLRNSNNVILASRGSSAPAIGTKAISTTLAEALEQSPSGYYWTYDSNLEIDQLVAYEKSNKLPLIFSVATPGTEIYASFWHHQEIYYYLTLGLTLILIAASIFDIRRQLTLDQAQRDLAALAMRFQSATENMSQGLSMFDAEGRLIAFNARYLQLYDMSPEQIKCGDTLEAILLEHTMAGSFHGDIDRYLQNHRHRIAKGEVIESILTPPNGRTIQVITCPKADGGWVATHDDVTERKNSEARIEQLAHYDSLTGLANRNLFRDRLGEFLARLRRHRSEFAILLLDLDRFKAVNDKFGHQVGDSLLREVGRRIKAIIREVDVAARLGGDEFALIVLPGNEDFKGGLIKVSERLVEAISAPYEIGGYKVLVGCSIGIAMAPQHGERIDELLRNADLALYKSKHSGRNCHQFYDLTLKTEADNRNELENDLRQAVWRGEFELFYQPIVAAQSGEIESFEALLRWRHPTKGLIAPADFIPLAEETGVITQLGDWVLIQACQDAMRMPASVKVAVNLSPVQFAKSNIVESVIFALVDSQLPANRLEIEITESVLLKEIEQNEIVLKQLQNLGVTIALDDFGVGYSALSYLTSFTFNKVKIDRSFVEKLDKPETKAVISSIVSLAQSLQLTTCAEGIETRFQLEQIQALGIGLCQGYFFGKPMPFDQVDFNPKSLLGNVKAA